MNFSFKNKDPEVQLEYSTSVGIHSSRNILSIRKCRNLLGTNEMAAVMTCKSPSMALQKANSYYRLKALLIRKTGINNPKSVQLVHQATGRPYYPGINFDLAISHLEDSVFVGLARPPFKLGLDVEFLNRSIDIRPYQKFFLSFGEEIVLREFSKLNHFNLAQGICIFWSIKESFFKCLDCPLRFKEFAILNIEKNGQVTFSIGPEIRKIMDQRKSRLISTQLWIDNERIYAGTLLKQTSEANLA